MPTHPSVTGHSEAALLHLQKMESKKTEEIESLIRLINQGRYAEAEPGIRALLDRFPGHGPYYKIFGAVLHQQGKLAEALVTMQRAATLLADDAETHYNLAVVFKQSERFTEAESSYRKACQLKPNFAPAYHGLGQVLKAQSRMQEAEISYRQAVKIKPDFVEALDSLMYLFAEQHDWQAGLRLANQYLQIAPDSSKAKSFFVRCVTSANLRQVTEATYANLVRAFDEPWCTPGALTPVSAALVNADAAIQPLVQKAMAASSPLSAQDLFGVSGLASVAGNALLKAMLVSASVCDVALERFLTRVRSILLYAAESASNQAGIEDQWLEFYCALARQCFINEHVYACTEDEMQRAGKLCDAVNAALEKGTDIPALWIVAVAAYLPLHKLPHSDQLLKKSWPEAVAAMLIPLVGEPLMERQLRATIPQLTPIEGEVSLSVQSMYEENPYPRWIKLLAVDNPATANDYVRLNFPLSGFRPLAKERDIEVLIAGCGTGRHSIGTAQKFKDAHVLAVDLSLSSLSYAKRKSQEFGLKNIDYAQADIMKLGELNRSFDVIESGGVLHHMADPWAGWRVLLSLLRPGGVMGIALYSEIARRDVVRGRAYIAQQGYASTPEGIRQCRQDMMSMNDSTGYASFLKANDFYSVSECRDLLFHVQEHRMTLTGINAFLRENNLQFLGMQVKEEVLAAYKARFPDDPSATRLEQWQVFENEHPDTFIGMYQFWLQKPA